MSKKVRTPMFVLFCLILGACSSAAESGRSIEAQYWQRTSASSAIYQRGPKAQQMLHRDIAHCVVEIRELERLGVLRNAIPEETGGSSNSDQRNLDSWHTPGQDGALLAEYGDYHDFEGCMLAKGWERVAHLPYDIAIEARDSYLRANSDYKYRDRFARHRNSRSTTQASGPYSGLNN